MFITTYGTNYHPDTATWLRQRFDNLPIHQACYYVNDDTQSAVDHLSTIVQQNKQALVATDAMGMTPLHILCCNPHITAEMVRVIVGEKEEDASALLTHTDVTGNTPLQLFMRCRGYLPVDADEEVKSMPSLFDLLMGILQLFMRYMGYLLEYVHVNADDTESMPSLHDLLEKGVSGEDLAILFALNDNQQIDMSGQNEETGLFPFMSAAVLPGCGLDVVYTLAMNDFSMIL